MADVIREFHAKHNRCGPYITVDGWLYWPDGASREQSGFGVLKEPHPNPHQRAKDVLFYWQKRLERAVEEFDTFKGTLSAQAAATARDGGDSPSEAALDELKQLQGRVKFTKDQVAAAQKEVEATVPPTVLARRAEIERQREAAREYAARVRAITV